MKIVLASLSALTILIAQPIRVAKASTTVPFNGVSPVSTFTATVVDAGCPAGSYSYSSEEDAVMDTIPGEWWKPSDYGVSVIPYAARKSAAIVVRSRIKYENSSLGGYSYRTANLNYHGGQNLLTHPDRDVYEMNTILANNPTGAGRNAGNSASYYKQWCNNGHWSV